MGLEICFADALQRVAPGLQRRLHALGAVTIGVLANYVGREESHIEVFEDLLKGGFLERDDELDFGSLIDLARRLHPRHQRAGTSRTVETLRAQQAGRDRERQREQLERMYMTRGASASASATPPPPAGAQPRRARSALGSAVCRGTGTSTTDMETAARERYLDELVDTLLEHKAPVVSQVAEAGDIRAALRLTAGGRRARTIRTRLRGWRAFSSWLQISKGRAYPEGWMDVIDYARVRASEPCGRQTLLGLYWAVAFMEKAGGYGVGISQHPLYQGACREVLSTVTARAGGQGPSPALRVPTAILALLERLVCDDDVSRWLRAFAYWKVLQCWCSLRHDDHRGIVPGGWRLVPGGRHLELQRTKTSGPDKRVGIRPVGLSDEAYLVEPRWAVRGEELWRELAPCPRDYLLAAPESGLDAAVNKELPYHAAAAWSRALMHRLCAERGLTEIKDHFGAHLTEHSGRHWLSSVAFALGAAETELEVLGGWNAKPARAYLDTASERMMTIQAEAAKHLRACAGGQDHVGERRLLAEIGSRLAERGLDAGKVKTELAAFDFFPDAAVGSARLWGVGSSDAAAAASAPAPKAGTKRPRLQDSEAKAVPAAERGYVISLGKTGFRRLHYAGACHRVPGIHYTSYEWLGVQLPPPTAYDAHCAKCWPDWQQAKPVAGPPAGAAASASKAATVAQAPADELDEGAVRSEASEDDSSSTQEA